MPLLNFFRRRRVADDGSTSESAPETPQSPPVEDDGMQRLKPVVRTYLYKSDATSPLRYLLLFSTVVGAFIWWLGPVLGVFMVDPFLRLMLMKNQVVDPTINCYDHRLTSQTCENDVMIDQYFYNITNKDEWLAGTAPPAYTEVGPYVFRIKEVRYNMQYSANWTEVEYTYHQYAEFVPESSCPTCLLNATITGINRGYLQFLSASGQAGIDNESGVIYQLTPITLAVIRDSMIAAISAPNPNSPTIVQDTIAQWTDCSTLLPLMPFLGLTTPYLKDVPLPPGQAGFPYHPELCVFIAQTMQALNVPATPANFAAFGVALDKDATATFLQLAIGQSTSSVLDPNAAQFVGAFLTLPRATLLGAVGVISPGAATSLSAINNDQWPLLQGYIASLVPTWGTLVFDGWLKNGGGGMIVDKTVETWLYGFEDPLLLTAAQGAYAGTPTPNAYKLMPWTYVPSIATAFPTPDYPVEYFQNGYKGKVKKVTTMLYNLTDTSTAACNLTYYGLWAGRTGFDPEAYGSSVNAIPPEMYWDVIRNDTALQIYLEESLGSTLEPYFGEADVYRDRCANPERFKGTWDLSGMLACPTIYTSPKFMGADDFVVETTGSNMTTWAPDPLQHGYSLAVEPLTRFAVQGHRTYQLNHLVSQTANLYPNLWVAPGSGAAVGLPADFVTVPVYWMRMWWEPTDDIALIMRIISIADDVFYDIFVMSFPVLGWVMLGTSLFILRFAKGSKQRRKDLISIQRSRARSLRLTRHEKEMVEGLSRIARGSMGVILPDAIPEGMSEAAEAGDASVESGPNSPSAARKPLVQAQRSMPVVRQSTWSGLDRPTTPARVLSLRTDAAPTGLVRQGSSNSREEPLLRATSSYGGASTSASGSGGNSTGSEAPLLKNNNSAAAAPGFDASAAAGPSTSNIAWKVASEFPGVEKPAR